jgi:phosphohistidine phosphatase
MLTLSLLRHAKSSWDAPGLDDFERPLARRGEDAAPRMGGFMKKQKIAPQLILCSPAVRTRQTLDLVLPYLSGAPAVAYEDALYLAAARTLLARVRKIDAGVTHAMLVGHDPGMHELAVDLAGSGEAEALAALAHKFPTAGLAVIAFEATTQWSRIAPGKGRLKQFMTPKTLP